MLRVCFSFADVFSKCTALTNAVEPHFAMIKCALWAYISLLLVLFKLSIAWLSRLVLSYLMVTQSKAVPTFVLTRKGTHAKLTVHLSALRKQFRRIPAWKAEYAYLLECSTAPSVSQVCGCAFPICCAEHNFYFMFKSSILEFNIFH